MSDQEELLAVVIDLTQHPRFMDEAERARECEVCHFMDGAHSPSAHREAGRPL